LRLGGEYAIMLLPKEKEITSCEKELLNILIYIRDAFNEMQRRKRLPFLI
jgi:hypothetical protein